MESFPRKGRYNLTSQISRRSIYISSKIASRSVRTNKRFSHFIDVFLGKSFELSTRILIVKHKKYISEQTLNELEDIIEKQQKMATSFQDS